MRAMAPCMAPTASTPWAAASRAATASWLACWALSADCRVMPETDSTEEEVSSSEEACSEAPEATAWDEDAICAAAPDTCSAEAATCTMASCRASAVAFTAAAIRAWSPWYCAFTRARRSRWASASRARAASFTGAVTASRVRFMPSRALRNAPSCRATSTRAESWPAMAWFARPSTSPTSRDSESTQRLRLCCMATTSPCTGWVRRGGTSPCEIRSRYSAATRSGATTACTASFTPSAMALHSPWRRAVSARTENRPSAAARATDRTSPATATRWVRMALTVSVIRACFPGSARISPEKSPSP